MRHIMRGNGECLLASAAMITEQPLNRLCAKALRYNGKPWAKTKNFRRINFLHHVGIVTLREAAILYLATSLFSLRFIRRRFRTPPEDDSRGFVLKIRNVKGVLNELFTLNPLAKRSGHACAFQGVRIYDPALPVPVHRDAWMNANYNPCRDTVLFIPIQRS